MRLRLCHALWRSSSAAWLPRFESAPLPCALSDFLGAVVAHRRILVQRLPAPLTLPRRAPRNLPPPLPRHAFRLHRPPIRILQTPRSTRFHPCPLTPSFSVPSELNAQLHAFSTVLMSEDFPFSLFYSPIPVHRYSSSTILIAPLSSNTTSNALPFFSMMSPNIFSCTRATACSFTISSTARNATIIACREGHASKN